MPGRRRPRGGPAPGGRCCRSGRARPEVMNRFTPSMCQVPSGCCTALVRPAPTSEPASGSVSTIVAPHCCSIMSSASFFCSGVPWSCRTCGEGRPGGVHVDGRVGAEHHLGDGPAQRRRGAEAAELARAGPAGTTRRPRRPRSDFLNDSGSVTECVGRVEDRRVAVGVDEGRGESCSASRPTSCSTSRAVSASISLERARCPGRPGRSEDLEEVELEVPQVALVVAHPGCPPLACLTCCRGPAAASHGLLPAGNFHDATRW